MNSTILSLMPRHGHPTPIWHQAAAAALSSLADCTQACLACADACLAEQDPAKLRRCIRIDLNCAAVCHALAQALHRQPQITGQFLHDLLRTCITACRDCHEECSRHAAMHEHCRICGAVCLSCQELCNRLLGDLTAGGATGN